MAMDRVLIIEDDEVIVELVSASLSKEGFRVESCGDGKTGMAQISKQAPDLLILDLGLPGMSGLEILQEFRGNPQPNPLPVIVLTARNEEADIIIGLELGADDYVLKPVRPWELAARVKGLLRRKKRPDADSKANRGRGTPP